MPLDVIGAGFGRTGTLSLKLALEQLGYDKCHHMLETFGREDHTELWYQAAIGNPVDWETVFDGYKAAVDWPVCHFWETLMDVYPEAKFILSVRPADDWFRSVSNTIFRVMSEADPADDRGKMARTIIRDQTFNGRFLEEDYAKSVFEAHNRRVQETIPADRLLVYETGSGWEPLCAFLGKAVPSEPYPRTNSTDEFMERIRGGAATPGDTPGEGE